jgi:hypothetical protein
VFCFGKGLADFNTRRCEMKAVPRVFHPVSVEAVLEDSRVELRIHGGELGPDAATLLDANEARALANALMITAERLDPVSVASF